MAELSLRRLLIKNTGVEMVAQVISLGVGLARSSCSKIVMLFRGINRGTCADTEAGDWKSSK